LFEGCRINKSLQEAKSSDREQSFQDVPKFPGKSESYDDWRFQMTTFLDEESKEWGEVCGKLGKFATMPTDKELEEIWQSFVSKGVDMIYMNNQLYNLLSMNLTENALANVRMC